MLSVKQFLFLFFVSLIPFFVFLSMDRFIGYDSFYFLDQVCNVQDVKMVEPLSEVLFSVLPCDFLFLKVFIWLVFFGCTVLTALIGSEFYKNGWLAGLFVFLTNQWIRVLFQFENDFVGLFFLLLGSYFFLKKSSLGTYKFLGLVSFLIAALFWRGAVFYFLAFSFVSLINFPFFVFAVVYDFDSFLYSITPGFAVLENMPFVSLGYLLFLNLGVFFLPKRLRVVGVVFFVLALLKFKYLLLAAPFLAVGFVGLMNELVRGSWSFSEFLLLDYSDVFLNWKKSVCALLVIVFWCVSFGLIVSSSFSLFNQAPYGSEIAAVKFVVSEADGSLIFNDWELGHIVAFYGGVPFERAGIDHYSGFVDWADGFAVTANHDLNCVLLEDFGERAVFYC